MSQKNFFMVLLEEYYELQEAENVSKFWKVLHIVFYVCAAGFGIWCGFTLAILRRAFDNRCFLFAKIVWEETESRDLRFVQPEYYHDESVWTQDTICEFCQYTMVASFIFATIWASFFLMCGNGGKSATGLPQPWRIVLPALVFNFMYFILAFAAALQINHGTNIFCEKSADFITGLESFQRCTPLKAYNEKKAHDLWIWLEIVNKTSWITTASWFVAFLIPFMRIVFVSDFNLYKISVYRVDELGDQNEEVMRVIEYEGKHVHFPERIDPGRQLHED